MVLALGTLASCDRFLNVEPSNYADSSTSIKTTADAQVMMNGLMRKMTSSSYYGRNFYMYADAKGGDLTIMSQGRGLDGLYAFNHQPANGSYSGFWEQIYHCIMQANNLLENIEKLENEGTSEDFDDYKGQALTLRALMHYDLVRLYGKPYDMDKASYGVPLVTRTLDASEQLGRNTVEEVYRQIVADLTAAAPLLSKSKNNGYVNYYANRAILARVCLQMQDYAGALTAAEEIIKNGPYKLYANNEWVNSWKTTFGSESIFELAILPNEADLGTASPGFYLTRLGHGASNAMGWFMGSDFFLERLGEDPDDVRWGVMDYDEATTADGDYYHMGACYKYRGGVNRENRGSSATFPGDGKSTSTAINIKVIRLSEVYLIAAEAALNSQKPDLAATYLNAIRKRAPHLAPASAQTVSEDMILDERSKELFAEGQRFFDMMRLNRSITFNDSFGNGTASAHRPTTIDRTFEKCRLPLGENELNANPALKGQQNPGY